MRRGFGLAGVLVTLILIVIVGAVAYNIGWSDGVNTHLPAGTTAPAPYYYGFHPFFAGFGILWFLFILFGIFWLFRLAFWGFAGRRMWGYGRGSGGWGGDGPRSFEDRAQDWHRRQHEGSSSGTTPPPPPPPPPDTQSV